MSRIKHELITDLSEQTNELLTQLISMKTINHTITSKNDMQMKHLLIFHKTNHRQYSLQKCLLVCYKNYDIRLLIKEDLSKSWQ